MRFDLLTEKYRPQKFDEFVGNRFIVEKIKKLCESPEKLPNFLIAALSPGTGKTTLAKLIVNTVGGDFVFLNASDERGINTIREKIKRFISSYSTKPGVPKFVIMDESDALTNEAQEALRTMIEQYSKNARFIFTANYISRIIPPIRSRCLVLNLSLPEKQKILERIKYICETEKIPYNEDGLITLVNIFYPDIRKMIIKLQELQIDDKKLTKDILVEKESLYDDIYKKIVSRDFNGARKIWLNDAIDFFDLTKFLFQKFLDCDLQTNVKQKIIYFLADGEMKMNFGVDPEIAFAAMVFRIIDILGGVNETV